MTATLAIVHPDTTGPSDYAILRRRVREAGLLAKEPWFYTRSIAVKTAALVACLLVLGLVHNLWVQAACAVALAIISGQLGFQLHDSGHRQMFANSWKNAVVGLVTGNLLRGMR